MGRILEGQARRGGRGSLLEFEGDPLVREEASSALVGAG
jgi:hypothetical protein